MVYQEVHHATLRATLKALVAVALWVDHERPQVAVVVKRAEPQVSDALLLQVNEVAYDLLNPRCVQNLLDDEFVNSFAHSLQKIDYLYAERVRVARVVDARPLPRRPPPAAGGMVHADTARVEPLV